MLKFLGNIVGNTFQAFCHFTVDDETQESIYVGPPSKDERGTLYENVNDVYPVTDVQPQQDKIGIYKQE